jgi:hypothetical protein
VLCHVSTGVEHVLKQGAEEVVVDVLLHTVSLAGAVAVRPSAVVQVTVELVAATEHDLVGAVARPDVLEWLLSRPKTESIRQQVFLADVLIPVPDHGEELVRPIIVRNFVVSWLLNRPFDQLGEVPEPVALNGGSKSGAHFQQLLVPSVVEIQRIHCQNGLRPAKLLDNISPAHDGFSAAYYIPVGFDLVVGDGLEQVREAILELKAFQQGEGKNQSEDNTTYHCHKLLVPNADLSRLVGALANKPSVPSEAKELLIASNKLAKLDDDALLILVEVGLIVEADEKPRPEGEKKSDARWIVLRKNISKMLECLLKRCLQTSWILLSWCRLVVKPLKSFQIRRNPTKRRLCYT